jgi:CNT family concentrative nucleoside transporter
MDVIITILRSLLGFTVLIAISYLFSNNRKLINWALVAKGIMLQILIAFILIKVPIVFDVFEWVASVFVSLITFANKGTDFLFGSLSSDQETFGFIFAFRVLPPILFFSALFSLLYYFRVLPVIIQSIAIGLKKAFGVSSAESLAAAANIFIGHTEAPLLIKPYLKTMTPSELFCLLTGGLATITGAVLAAATGLLGGGDPEKMHFYATHFLTASIISAPAAIVAAKIIFPETEPIDIGKIAKIEAPKSENAFDAIANGTFDGLKLTFNVAALLLVFISLIALINFILGDIIGQPTGLNEILGDDLSLEYIFGIAFAPVAWIIGIDAEDVMIVGRLLGEKTAINEFYAYISMNTLINDGLLTNNKSILISSYALCGFANFGSIGIMIGAISSLAPERKGEVAGMSIRALFAGTIACLMTGCVAGLLTIW